MIITGINWISESAREAELVVSDGVNSITCFSQPCPYSVGELLNDELHGFDVGNVMRSVESDDAIEKLRGPYAYFLRGMISDVSRKLVKVSGFEIILESGTIPGDIKSGDYVEFTVRRIDVY